MGEAQNTKIVQDAYAAFGRGDIPGLVAYFDENIRWQPVKGAASYVPQHGERRGKAAVGEFFRTLPEVLTFERFEPREFIAQGDRVVTLGHYRGKAPGGGTFDADFVMVFTVRNGKVTEFEEYTDTAQVNAAYQPVRV